MSYLDTASLKDLSVEGACGVDLPDLEGLPIRTGCAERKSSGLPQLSESQAVRYFTRLSRLNYAAIDMCFYPLGSCTMKYNPRINEVVASLPGFADIHPYQSECQVQGALEIMYDLQNWLKDISGLSAVGLSPAAGAHGEYAGLKMIKAAHELSGQAHRNVVIVPDSAHGTNPATASACGYKTIAVPSNSEGTIDVDELKKLMNENVAAVMVTNPNTCGVFEGDIEKIAELTHGCGAYLYYDGANMNAIVGRLRPADFGVDVMHFNLHKTFSTPHGGGGPGAGPIAVSKRLAPFLPAPVVVKKGSGYTLKELPEHTIGRVRSFHGQFAILVRALAYMLSYGMNDMGRIADDAILSANYILSSLKDDYYAPFSRCMHECLLTDKLQADAGVSANVIAKTLIENGIHPMTVYFPLIFSGSMLIEPTETESKREIDNFISVMKDIAEKVRNNDVKDLLDNPKSLPVCKVDEVKAARNPVLHD